MKPVMYEYGELVYSQGKWTFRSGDKNKIFEEQLQHVIMSSLGAGGWDCIFISNNMLHAFFKKIVKPVTPKSTVEE